MHKLPTSLILRIGLGLVLLWFGVSEIVDPETWSSYVPMMVQSLLPISVNLFVTLHGIFEVLLAVLLLVGYAQRIVRVVAVLHLVSITIGVGYNEIGVRDFGLVMAALALAMSDDISYSLDAYLSRR